MSEDKELEFHFNTKDDECPPEKKDRTVLAIAIGLVFVAIVVGSIVYTYYTEQQELKEEKLEGELGLEDISKDELMIFTVTNSPPFARDSIGIDYVGDKISHTIPTTQEVIRTLVWSKTLDRERLLELESTLINATKMNNNTMSMGEKYFLDVITWSAYPEFCEKNIEVEQCKFFDILYNQGLYQNGEISRDQYWLNIKKYADAETIAEVEKNDKS